MSHDLGDTGPTPGEVIAALRKELADLGDALAAVKRIDDEAMAHLRGLLADARAEAGAAKAAVLHLTAERDQLRTDLAESQATNERLRASRANPTED